jgi:hypothetical protein
MCIDNSLPLEMWSVNDADVIKNMNSYISGVTSDTLIASQILSSSNGVEITEVPEHVKKITKLDIAKWNSASGDGSSSQVYSEEETVIGTWLGKPLYRKVLTGTTVAGDTVIDLSSLNINYISKMDGTVGTNFDYRPVNFYLDGHYHSTRFAYGNLYLASTSSYANLPFTIVLEYTKTTD